MAMSEIFLRKKIEKNNRVFMHNLINTLLVPSHRSALSIQHFVATHRYNKTQNLRYDSSP